MRVLFATAELVPLAKVGGLAEASAGLVRGLRRLGLDVEVVLPDYGGLATTAGVQPLDAPEALSVPAWCGPMKAQRVDVDGFGPVTLVSSRDLQREHPYVDPVSGWGWPNNDHRFLSFSAAVGALVRLRRPDVVHVNDWHTAAALSWVDQDVASVLTIHNLSHQGQTDLAWLERLGPGRSCYDAGDHVNVLAGGIRRADRVIAVSESYSREIREPTHGCGLDELLRARGDDLRGIRNGIDTDRWDPSTDPQVLANYSAGDLSGKELCTKELRRFAGFDASRSARVPVVGLVARFVDQKGVDLALALAPFLEHLPAQLVLLGAGEAHLTALAEEVELAFPNDVWFARGYDDALAHQLIAGSDLLLMPSRFEPCGLTQMEALRYGSIPVVTAVGGLRDTVVDADADPRRGTGFVAAEATVADLIDALHRAVRAWTNRRRRQAIQLRGMTADWSWQVPARHHVSLYSELVDRG